jgi:hypothetical protein
MRLQERNGSLDILLSRPVDTALKFVLYQVLEFGKVLGIHIARLPQFGVGAAQELGVVSP